MTLPRPKLSIIQILIAIGGGLLLTYFFSPDAKLLENDLSNNIFERQLSADRLSFLVPYKSDLSYCNSANPQQSLDIYLPPSSEPTPLVIFIHGGGWTYGDKKSKVLSYYGEPLVKRGIAIASLNYRTHPESHYPDAYDDIACALGFLKNNAADFNINTHKWGIMGDSAGAELAAYTLQAQPEYPLVSFVGLYGPYDLGLQLTRTPLKDVSAVNFTGSSDPIFAASISPISQSIKVSASYLLIHGKDDRIVPPQQSKKYYDKITSAGAAARLIEVDNTGHYIAPTSQPSNAEIRRIVTDYLYKSLTK